MKRCIPLEPAAEEVCRQSAIPPLIFQLPPKKGRERLEKAQDTPVYKYPADISSTEVDCGKWGTIPVYFVVPKCSRIENLILYIHGGGWVFGSFHTHEKLVRELAARTNSVVVFPEYIRAPEAKYSVAIEQCYYVLSHLREIIEKRCSDMCSNSLIVVGDSVGGNMAVSMEIMSNLRGGPHIQKLLLFYPVTNACFDTPSYSKFAVNYYLYREGMIWFWQQYAPCPKKKGQITASPLKASLRCLSRFPSTMIINAQSIFELNKLLNTIDFSAKQEKPESIFKKEIARRLSEEGYNFSFENGEFAVTLNDGDVIKIRKDDVLYSSGEFSETSREAFYALYHLNREALDYCTAYEKSAPLIADGLSGNYRCIMDFNGTVLAAKYNDEFGFEFVTWNRIFDGKSVCNGNYCSDYASAKENFAIRSGLIDKDKLFGSEELEQIRKCVNFTMRHNGDLNFDDCECLKKLNEKISESIPEQQQNEAPEMSM